MGSSIIGAAVKRVEDPRFISGSGRYITNMQVKDALWMVPVRSPVPHGRIVDIDDHEAGGMSGVVGIFRAEDLDVGCMPIDAPGQPESTRRPVIASDIVRFVGDIVAVVVAESELIAIDAASTVWVDIDPLPAVATPDDALATGAPILFLEHASNVVLEGSSDPIPDLFADSDVVVTRRIVHQRLAAVPLEPSAAVAIPRGEDIELHVSSQNVFLHRNAISRALGLDRNRLHVKVPDMGGGFGAKIVAYPEQALVVALALELGRPVRWHERRAENLVAMTQGRAQVHHVELGARRDGVLTGVRFRVIQDAGAYPLNGAYIPEFTRRMASGPYRIPQVDFSWMSVVTNTTPIHAYRGAGRPEATMTLERMMDVLAHELAIDPAELRRRNFIGPNQFPYTTATGERYDTGDYEAALELALQTAGYDELRREQRRRRDAHARWQLGIGLSSYVEITAPEGRKDWGAVEIDLDGAVTVRSGASSHGQGHETTFAQIAAEVLKVPVEAVRFIQGDSDLIDRGGGTMGSRSMQMGGTAVFRSSRSVLDKARRIVARLTEASPKDVVQFDDGRIGVAGVPDTGKTLAEIAHLAADPANLDEGMEPGLKADDTWAQGEATVPFGTHVSVLEVDTETGDVRILRHIACDDCGHIFNRAIVDGQVHGGVAQAVGQALFEQVLYDADANPLTTNLASYQLPTAAVLPSFEVDHTVTPTDENALGAKGIGEAGTIGAGPAVVNAVLDALSPFGVEHIDMPLTPMRIWEALDQARPA